MSIKRFIANKDNTITDAFNPGNRTRGTSSNMGASDSAEIFSIYAQANTSSLERARALFEFPIQEILTSRNAGKIQASGSATFRLKIFNVEHTSTTPEDFKLVVSPLLEPWSEGIGLDMETYTDKYASNWLSSSLATAWKYPGSTHADSIKEDFALNATSENYEQTFSTGHEDLSIDVTPLVEKWLLHEAGNSIKASGSIQLTGVPTSGHQIKLYTYGGDNHLFQFSTSSVNGDSLSYVEIAAGDIPATRNNLLTSISATSKFTGQAAATDKVIVKQVTSGFYGNTKISSSAGTPIAAVNFAGGTGIVNYGLVAKLSGSAETGATKASYYTKRFSTRKSEFFMKRPVIEVQQSVVITDDRGNLIKSSVLAEEKDNLNKIYFYNYINNSLKDIPSAAIPNGLIVRLATSSAGSADVELHGPNTHGRHALATKISTGVYEAQFGYSGSVSTLYDVWQVSGSNPAIYTGSAMKVNSLAFQQRKGNQDYTINITNLKPSYRADEVETFRVYTRNKDWSQNVYTKATQTAPVDTIKESFYSVKRVADNHEVISYSTSSATAYSKLSYDASGSFFDLDMSILEPNYLYEVSILSKQDDSYVEQKEKFRFRIDP